MTNEYSYLDRGRAAPQNHLIYSDYLGRFPITLKDHSALNSRGLNADQIRAAGYASKSTNNSKQAMAALSYMNSHFELDDVPGFFVNDKGHRNHKGTRGLMVPSRDVEGNVYSLVIRLEKPNTHEGRIMNKYMAFSSAKETKGGKVWQNTHCPAIIGLPKSVAGDVIRVTEGVLKADVATALGKLYCIGFHGVNPHRDFGQVLSGLEVETVHVAFDAGEETYDVLQGRARTIKALREFGVNVVVEKWNPKLGKGVDDVIAAGHEDKIEQYTAREVEDILSDANVRDPNNGEWVYVVADEKFYHVEKFRKLNKSQFADTFGLLKVSKVNILLDDGFEQVADTEFYPGQERLFYNDDEKMLNLWRDPKIDPVKGDISLMLDHIAYLFPMEEEAAHLLDWLAYCISKPAEKIFYAVLMQSEAEGVGKSWFGEMLRAVLGKDNACMLSSNMLSENFTGWAKKSSVGIVEEVWSAGKMEFMNKMKPMITEPRIPIRQMNREAYEITNRINFFMTTNYSDALKIDRSDRRYLVMVTDAEPKTPDYYKKLFEWLEGEKTKSALLYYFTKDHKYHVDFCAKGKAPKTKAREELIKESRSVLEEWISSNIEEQHWPLDGQVIAIRHIKNLKSCPHKLAGISNQKWANALKKYGALAYDGQITSPNGSGKKIKVWLIGSDKDRLKDCTPSEVAKAYQDGFLDKIDEQESYENPLEESEPI